MENSTEAQAAVEPTRHVCHFTGCGKAFIRKEHLTRHKKSHVPQRSFICHVCQRGFTRNDILRRHIARHDNSAKATARNGRACDGCHGSKVKCEGGQPCLLCIKRGTECKFERDEVIIEGEGPARSTVDDDDEFFGEDLLSVLKDTRIAVDQSNAGHTQNDQPKLASYSDSAIHSIPNLSMSTFDVPEWFISAFGQRSAEGGVSGDTIQSMLRTSREQLLNVDNTSSSCNGEASPLSVRAGGYYPGMAYVRSIPKSVTKEHYELYLDRFHYRWPIINVPAFEREDNPYVLSGSVEMIGSWLEGSYQSKHVALTLHDRLTNHIFQRMYQKPSYNDRYKPWSTPFYQAALLNVIFGLYCGKEFIISRTVLLCSMLISSLRDLGFFRPEIAGLQDQGATFPPYVTGREEERKRLALALFKIDCYIAIIRSQPMTLRCDELHFSLPSSFSLLNTSGLQVWEARASDEPVERRNETISWMISGQSFSCITQPFMFVEDIQLGMVAIQSDIWHYSEKIKLSKENELSISVQQRSLRDRLNSWKRLLDETAITDSGLLGQRKTNVIPMKYYYGVEDHSRPDWQQIVLNRPQGLLLDTAMLYHLFCMHIHANTRALGVLASDYCLSTIREDMKEREGRVRQWSSVFCGRQAVLHAANIIFIYRSRNRQLTRQNQAVNGDTDPIAHIAVAFSSLVVWAYCWFNGKGCELCIEPAGISNVVELMDIVAKNDETDKWAKIGGRAAIDGQTLCRCNSEKLTEIFQQYLPHGSQRWDLAYSLSVVLKDASPITA